MSISAAELPAMAGALGSDPSGAETVRRRLSRRAEADCLLCRAICNGVLSLGRCHCRCTVASPGDDSATKMPSMYGPFSRAPVWDCWRRHSADSYSSTYYAFQDTRTPLRFALVRVALTTILGYFFAFPLPRLLNIPGVWGAAGLTASAGLSGWVEMMLLRRRLHARIGSAWPGASYLLKLWGAAIFAAAVAWGIKLVIPVMHPAVIAIVVLGPYGLVYFAADVRIGHSRNIVGTETAVAVEQQVLAVAAV